MLEYSKTAPEVDNITANRVAKWLDRPRQDGTPRSAGTKRVELSTLKVFTDWLYRRGVIDRDPLTDLRVKPDPPKPPRTLTADEAKAIIDAAGSLRDRCVVIWSLQVGMRRGELAAMQLEDIDRSARTVLIRGKGGHLAHLPIPDEAMHALDTLLAAHPAARGPVFRSTTTFGQLTPAAIGAIWTRAARRAGVKMSAYDGISAHAGRRTMVSDVLDKAGPVAAKDAARHADWSSLHHYTRWRVTDELTEAMRGRRYAS